MSNFDTSENANVEDVTDEFMADDVPEEGKNTVVQVDDALALAASMKDSGNTCFKGGMVDDALSSYEAAIDALMALTETEQGEDKVKPVLVALYGNVCMCRVKKEQWNESIEAADQVIKRDENNVKALYRRGLAKMKSGILEGAQRDFNNALKVEPHNAAAKKELAVCDRTIRELEKKEAAKMKAAYAGNMFGGGKGFYEDREKERAAKKRREEDEENRLRDEWTKLKLDRRNKGLPEQTFEEYKTELKEEKEKAEKERKEKAEAAKKASPPSSSSSSSSTSSSSPRLSPLKKPVKKEESSDDDTDDEDLKDLVKGYKTRSDGHKTSYFNNELDEQTKALIGDITPKALVSADPSAMEDSLPQPVAGAASLSGSTGSGSTVAPSAWNHAGTFESKDMTNWAKNQIEQVLSHVRFALPSDSMGNPPSLHGGIDVTVTEVKDVKGDAEIVISRGKKKAIYDLSATVSFEAIMDTSSATMTEKKFKGSVKVSDITGDDEPECSYSLKKAPAPEYKARLDQALKGLIVSIKNGTATFKNNILEQ
jgi:tetratricopeptide (TPR) repeat protein